MNEKTFARSTDDLKGIRERYESMRAHFERVFAQAKRLAEEPESPLKGKGLVAKMDAGAILIEFLDRRVRISMRYDREKGRGVLHVDDESAVRPGRAPETFERIEFRGTGETDLVNEHGDQLTLATPGDCMLLVARLIDTALDRDPWKKVPPP